MRANWFILLAQALFLALPVIMLLGGGQGQCRESPGTGIVFEGGPGNAMDNAVIIKGAQSSWQGIDAEYQYLEKRFGKRNLDWRLKEQRLLHQGKRSFDLMQIELKDGTKKDIYFDITDFFGKF
jgi:hypothetical protein